MSIAGFDDIPVVRDLTPSLTTVALPLEKLGERAMDLALKAAPGTRPRVVRMSGEVVQRRSTAAPAR
jgi:LacI family transcriptional regulator